MTVWHEEGNEIIFPEKWSNDIFDANNDSLGYDFDNILPNDNTCIVTIKISKWSVTDN